MHIKVLALLAVAGYASAQTVVGKAYGFAAGVTGGGAAAGVVPRDAADLAKLLGDDVVRTILINREWDFTGTEATGKGCSRPACNPSNGGQLFLGELSCGLGETPVSSITYDSAGTAPIIVGSNKSILGVGGKGILNGKGLRLKSGAKNVIIQGITITNLNPGICWGGDALDITGGNTVWVDHCKFSLIGRMFVVSHYTASKITLSNNEFDGVTPTTSTCNGDHYWTMMFIANGDQVTLDRNLIHDVSGRAPKLGSDTVSMTAHATNNVWKNLKGHAFDGYAGTTALIEGNVFQAVDQPTLAGLSIISTIYTVANGGAACQSALGRACVANSVDAASGKLAGGEGTGALTALGKVKANVVTPVAVNGVSALVLANAGPSKLGAATVPVPAPAPAAPVTIAEVKAKLYEQCNGTGFTKKICENHSTCAKQNEWFWQCVPDSAKARRQIRENAPPRWGKGKSPSRFRPPFDGCSGPKKDNGTVTSTRRF